VGKFSHALLVQSMSLFAPLCSRLLAFFIEVQKLSMINVHLFRRQDNLLLVLAVGVEIDGWADTVT